MTRHPNTAVHAVHDRLERTSPRAGFARTRALPGAMLLLLCLLAHASTALAQIAAAPQPWRIPSPKADTPNPTPTSPESVARGKAQFMLLCVACHGNGGHGDGIAAVALNPRPADLARPALWEQPDGELFHKITEGRIPMPPLGPSLTETQRWDVVNFLRSLSTRPDGVKQVAVAAATVAAALAAPQNPDAQRFVSREEYDALKRDMEMLKARLAALDPAPPRNTNPATPAPPAQPAPQPAQPPVTLAPQPANTAPAAPFQTPPATVTQQQRDAARDVTSIGQLTRDWDSRFVITGDIGVNYTAQKGATSTFSAGFSPLFLWEVSDRILVEAGLDFSLENDPNGDNAATATELSLANISYVVNDHLTVGGGLFAVPFGLFHVRLDPRWINKLPDEPLPYGDAGIAPNTAVGVFAGGGFACHNTKFNYAFYATNGPNLNTTSPDAAGSLSFDNFSDPNDNKAFGGRIGVLPVPELEVGYSFQFARANPNGFQKADALIQAFDASYKREFEWLAGTVDARVEWIWSNVDRTTYDADGSLGFGPTRFNNNRNGGYVQVAYRPTLIRDPFIRNLEGVFRFDRLQVPAGAPGGGTEQRYTIGVNYWVLPMTVFKTAYEIDDNKSGPSHNALLLEFSTGF